MKSLTDYQIIQLNEKRKLGLLKCAVICCQNDKVRGCEGFCREHYWQLNEPFRFQGIKKKVGKNN